MNIEEWRTLEYQTSNGQSPLVDWLQSLPPRKAAKILEDIQRFERFGPKHKPGFCEKLTNVIFYIRSKHGRDSFRIFWFQWHNRTAVITHGYHKKQNKADKHEIRKAEMYRSDWIQRH